MERIIIDFGEKKTTEKEFYGNNNNKKIFNIKDININEILISKGLFPGLNLNEYVIGYRHNHKLKPLYIKLPKYVFRGKAFKKNMTISSEIDDAYFLKNTIKYGRKLRN